MARTEVYAAHQGDPAWLQEVGALLEHPGADPSEEGQWGVSALAVAGLTFSLASYALIVFGVPAPAVALLGVVLSWLGLRSIRRERGGLSGWGIAQWGLWLGTIMLVLVLVLTLFARVQVTSYG